MSSEGTRAASGRVLSIPATLSGLATLELSFTAEHVLLITLNRPKALNVFNEEMEEEMRRVLEWVDEDAGVWVIILTGAGSAFCAGGDLKPALDAVKRAPDAPIPPASFYGLTSDGFGFLSRRTRTTWPIIAAVNGLTLGGGVEIVLNCDLVIASHKAKFGFVEVKNGLVAVQGAIPRLSRISGHQLASENYLTGRTVSAQEACDRFGFVNRVVPQDRVLSTAIEFANQIVTLAASAGHCASPVGLNPQMKAEDYALEAIQTTKRKLVESRNIGVVAEDYVAKL